MILTLKMFIVSWENKSFPVKQAKDFYFLNRVTQIVNTTVRLFSLESKVLSIPPRGLKMNMNQMEVSNVFQPGHKCFGEKVLTKREASRYSLIQVHGTHGYLESWSSYSPLLCFVLRTRSLWEVILATVQPFKP